MRKYILMAALGITVSAAAQQKAPTCRVAPKARIQALNAGVPTVKGATAAADRVSAYLTTSADADWQALQALGVRTVMRLDTIATATLPLSRLAEISAVRGVKYVQTAAPAHQTLDLAKAETGADKVNAGQSLTQAYTGQGVVVGIVDAGFDYTHKAFYTADGQLRIKRVWEQSTTATGSYHAPEKYGYGTELSSQSEIEGASGDISGNSHGTHVAAIAAGSDSFKDGAYKGVAPDADIVLVSMGESSRDNVNISNAIAYIFDYADAQGKPCVVNLSLGNHAGPHDGTSTFDVVTDKLQGTGHLIVGAAGNHRTDKFHVAKTFTGADDTALRTFIEFNNAQLASNVGGDIDIWGSQGCDFEVELSAYRLTTGVESEQTVVYPSAEAVQSVSLGNNIKGTITVSSETSPLNGKPHVLLTSALTNLRAKYAVAVTVRPKGAGTVDIWADNNYLGLTANDIAGFTEPGEASTISEIGGTAKRILTVGAYTTRDSYLLYGYPEATRLTADTVAHLGSFSSCGPTADGRMKPEVTAPGCFIISAVSQNDATSTKMVAEQYTDESRTYQYGYMQGTSMSSPFVAGTVATWLQACPTLTPEDLKDIVSATSRTDQYTAAPANGWGYGKLDAYEGLKKAVALAAAGIESVSHEFAGTITMQGGAIRVLPLSADAAAEVRIYTPGGSLMGVYIIGGETTIPTASLPHGVYMLSVSDASGVKVMKFRK